MSTFRYLKEHRLVDVASNQSPYPHQKPTKHYLNHHQRSVNVMHIIFNELLNLPFCKQPLNVYFIQELTFWASQSAQTNIKHHYLFKSDPKHFKYHVMWRNCVHKWFAIIKSKFNNGQITWFDIMCNLKNSNNCIDIRIRRRWWFYDDGKQNKFQQILSKLRYFPFFLFIFLLLSILFCVTM